LKTTPAPPFVQQETLPTMMMASMGMQIRNPNGTPMLVRVIY